MNCFLSKVALCLSFSALPLLTQCGSSDSDSGRSPQSGGNGSNNFIRVTAEDLATLQDGDFIGFSAIESATKKSQALSFNVKTATTASATFTLTTVTNQGQTNIEKQSSQNATIGWIRNSGNTYTLECNDANLGSFSATLLLVPDRATRDALTGKIDIIAQVKTINHTNIQGITGSLIPWLGASSVIFQIKPRTTQP